MSPPRWKPRITLVLLAIATMLGSGCGHHDDHLPRVNPRPSKLPAAPSPQAHTVTLPDGRTQTCPTGAAPQAKLTAATFAPPLKDGTTLSPGQYRVTLHVILENETTAAITIQALTVTVGGQRWDTPMLAACSFKLVYWPPGISWRYTSALPLRGAISKGR